MSNERSYFSVESRQRHGRVSVLGRLRGVELAQGVARLELRPYVLTRGERAPPSRGNPCQQPRDANASAELDARYGIGANFTLDATVNPDFGQVEVDPAVINLRVLGALTVREEGQAYFAHGDTITTFSAEPRTEYAVFGAQQELGGGATVGGMLSMMHRNLPGDRSLQFLRRGPRTPV